MKYLLPAPDLKSFWAIKIESPSDTLITVSISFSFTIAGINSSEISYAVRSCFISSGSVEILPVPGDVFNAGILSADIYLRP